MLTNEDKKFLRKNGYAQHLFSRVEAAEEQVMVYWQNKRISNEMALLLLGRQRFLKQVAQSVVYCTSYCILPDGKEMYFDSSKLHRKRR